MRVQHPDGDSLVDVNGDLVETDADGVFEVPDGATSWQERWAAQFDESIGELRVGSDDLHTCQAVKQDGEVCGRELPCPYHNDSED